MTEITQVKLDEMLAIRHGDTDGAPEWIRVAQDGVGMHGGFWTCAAATENSPMYIRSDLVKQALASQALRSQGEAQCCVCGKKGLSTVEGDGGTECQLNDGRWTCSRDCYYTAADWYSALTHPAPQEAGDVKVKPLEWEQGEAQCAFGLYSVHNITPLRWSVRFNGTALGTYGITEAMAQRQAQSDLNSRILSTLTEGSSR